MSGWGVLVPVAAVTVGPVAWVVNNWVRARHGHVPERYEGEFEEQGKEERKQLSFVLADNERLTGKVARLEERIAVLERIATDPAIRTAREIEALRDH
jgi:hypothetical protein